MNVERSQASGIIIKHRVGQRTARLHQELHDLVEAGRVAHAARDERRQFTDRAAGARRYASVVSRAVIQLRLPRTVLISPLCAM